MRRTDSWLAYIVITLIGGGIPLGLRLIFLYFNVGAGFPQEVTPIKEMAFFGIVLHLAVGYELLKNSSEPISERKRRSKLWFGGVSLFFLMLFICMVLTLTHLEIDKSYHYAEHEVNVVSNWAVAVSFLFSTFIIYWSNKETD